MDVVQVDDCPAPGRGGSECLTLQEGRTAPAPISQAAVKARLKPLVQPVLSRGVPLAVARRWPSKLISKPRLTFADDRLSNQPRQLQVSLPCGCHVTHDSRDMLPRWIYLLGVWEPAITSWISKQLSPGDTFVDIGANFGYYTLMMSHRVSTEGRVVAVEPSGQSFSWLSANCAKNGLTNVSLVRAAVAESGKSEVLLSAYGPSNSGATHGRANGDSGPETERVATISVGELLSRENIVGRPRVIKIDIEGMELPILSELVADPLLLPQVVDIVVEVNGGMYPNGWDDLLPILESYKKAGFDVAELYNSYVFSQHLPRQRKDPQPFSPPGAARPRGWRQDNEQADLVLYRR